MSQYICTKLKKKQGIWRVDGLGRMLPNLKSGFNILFHFSQIHPEYLKNSAAIKASTGETFSLEAHCAWLRQFTPGSLWENGVKIAEPKTIHTPITVNTNLCIYSSANRPYSTSLETLLPKSHINLGDHYDDLANAKYALIPTEHASTPWLIVPTAELFRFYFGSSTRLISKAFTGSINQIIGKNSGFQNGELTIYDMAGNLTKLEAYQFGRTLMSIEASEAFYGTHKQLAIAHLASPKAVYINSEFPFKNRTTLHVAGKRIPLTNYSTSTKEWAIFVMQIKHCSFPVGIRSIHFIRAGKLNGEPGHTSVNGRTPVPPKNDLDWPVEINNDPADPSLGRTTNRNVIPMDQLDKIHTRQTLVPEDFFCELVKKSSTLVSGHTFNDPMNEAAESGNLGIDEVDVSTEPITQDIQYFLDMLQHLRVETRSRDWEVKTLSFKNTDQKLNHEFVTTFPSPGKRYSWYGIPSNSGDFDNGDSSISIERPRKAVWVQVRTGTSYIYLVEMELRNNEAGRSTLVVIPKDPNNPQLTKENFRDLLLLTGVKHGWPSQYDKWRYKKHSNMAKAFFQSFGIEQIPFPDAIWYFTEDDNDLESTGIINVKKWAVRIEFDIKNMLL